MTPTAPAEPSPVRLANPLLRASTGWLSAWALVGLLGMLPAAHAAVALRAHAARPERLRPATRGSITAAHLRALILAAMLIGPPLLQGGGV